MGKGLGFPHSKARGPGRMACPLDLKGYPDDMALGSCAMCHLFWASQEPMPFNLSRTTAGKWRCYPLFQMGKSRTEGLSPMLKITV